jgi:hypothetical protein
MSHAASGIGNQTGRKFQSAWKETYPWIVYSEEANKLFCKICQSCDESGLFRVSKKKRDDAFTTTGYSNWKNALNKFEKHDVSQSHQEAILHIAHRTKGTNVAG